MTPTTTPPSPSLIVTFIPLLIFTLPFLIVICMMVRRKGKSVLLYFVLGLIPFVNAVMALWLASQTDASIKAELAELRAKLGNTV